MTQEEKQEIGQALELRGVGKRPCPLCGQLNWVLDTEYAAVIRNPTPNFVVGSPRMSPFPPSPCALLQCNQCGFLSLHNIHAIGVQSEP